MNTENYPCHLIWPKDYSKWCDHSGPGGFMGHTCERRTDRRREEDKDYGDATTSDLIKELSKRKDVVVKVRRAKEKRPSWKKRLGISWR